MLVSLGTRCANRDGSVLRGPLACDSYSQAAYACVSVRFKRSLGLVQGDVMKDSIWLHAAEVDPV